jgi:hypothetical protein
MSCDNHRLENWSSLSATKGEEKKIMISKRYSPIGTAYFLNKYDWKDCLDYNTSNSDVQKFCQMLKLYHKLV